MQLPVYMKICKSNTELIDIYITRLYNRSVIDHTDTSFSEHLFELLQPVLEQCGYESS